MGAYYELLKNICLISIIYVCMSEKSFVCHENKKTINQDDEFIEKEFDLSKVIKNSYAKNFRKNNHECKRRFS